MTVGSAFCALLAGLKFTYAGWLIGTGGASDFQIGAYVLTGVGWSVAALVQASTWGLRR